MIRAIVFAVAFLATSSAQAHQWYSKKQDPVTRGACCGGTDCAELRIVPGVLTPEAEGYRIRLTVEQARAINPNRTESVDVLVKFDRVQPSEDGNWHMCISTSRRYWLGDDDFFCFFAPPST